MTPNNLTEILSFENNHDLLIFLKYMNNKDNEHDIYIEFTLNNNKYEILIPSYDMTWRLFDFPYINNNSHRRILTQKSSIIDFINSPLSYT